VAKLPLNHHERDALTSHLDGVHVAQLVRGKTAAHSGPGRDSSHLCAGGSRRPRPTTGGPWMTQNSAPTGSVFLTSSQGES